MCLRPALQQQVILQAIQTTECPLTDIACICGNKEFVDELVEQIPLLCSAEDIARKSRMVFGLAAAPVIQASSLKEQDSLTVVFHSYCPGLC